MVIGTIAALAHGAIMPLMVLIFGEVIDGLVQPGVRPPPSYFFSPICYFSFYFLKQKGEISLEAALQLMADYKREFINVMTEKVAYFASKSMIFVSIFKKNSNIFCQI